MRKNLIIIIATMLIGATTPAMAAGEDRGLTLLNWVIILAPFAVVVALAFLPRGMRKWGEGYWSRQEQHFQRVESALERIATSLEHLEKGDRHDAL
jgi:hypothetical protein